MSQPSSWARLPPVGDEQCVGTYPRKYLSVLNSVVCCQLPTSMHPLCESGWGLGKVRGVEASYVLANASSWEVYSG